jgi:hypothetical protein
MKIVLNEKQSKRFYEILLPELIRIENEKKEKAEIEKRAAS